MTNSALGVGESIHEEVTFDMDIVKWVGPFQVKKVGNASQKKEIAHACFKEVNDSATKY